MTERRRPASQSKYAKPERERRFVVAEVPRGPVVRTARIVDRYIDGTRLRLRSLASTDAVDHPVFKLTQKIPNDQGGPGLITTVYVSAAEYAVFRELPARELQKTRLSIPPFGVDVFDAPLSGLILAEAEFESDEEMDRFDPPPWSLAEVTNDRRFTGGTFVSMTAAELDRALADVAPSLRLRPKPERASPDIRAMHEDDLAAVLAIIDRAFHDPKVRRLVELIRASGRSDPELSFVAVEHDEVVGHLMLSRVDLVAGATTRAVLNLTPLSVTPTDQRRGIGGALVARAIELAAERHEPFILVEGDPGYYARLGFEPASAFGIERPSALIPEPAFQVYRLGAWTDRLRGRIEYPSAFWEAGAVGPS